MFFILNYLVQIRRVLLRLYSFDAYPFHPKKIHWDVAMDQALKPSTRSRITSAPGTSLQKPFHTDFKYSPTFERGTKKSEQQQPRYETARKGDKLHLESLYKRTL